MLSRKEAAGLMLVASAAVGLSNAYGADRPDPVDQAATVTGTFVSTDSEGTSFTMRDESGESHNYKLAPTAQVNGPDGKPCRISELKAGQKIEVTPQADEPQVAIKVICVTWVNARRA